MNLECKQCKPSLPAHSICQKSNENVKCTNLQKPKQDEKTDKTTDKKI